jgi:RNA polymerase sigma-70 factor (ECF subfamily)
MPALPMPMPMPETAHETGADAPLTFEGVYHAWFDPVVRWLRALGGLEGDLEDCAQEVFLVVRRRLPTFDGRHLAGWLYAIAARTVRDRRRRAWFRNLWRRRSEAPLERLASPAPGPAELLQEAEARRLLARLLGRLSEKRRTVYVLFAIEGLSGAAIAAAQGIPVKTVWTRLHHARRDLAAQLARLRRTEASR